ncbi:hypothetical protein CEP54_004235 [Fusarium duplospermum]|uniref:Uncharacterized protein n=1 Tax=Fusarium duplospermum TaxID=1325734 RepID=A0A428QJL8_9HYPO|nr:hypothetical protein CEP54_004235 [Fusarium duplospermum]
MYRTVQYRGQVNGWDGCMFAPCKYLVRSMSWARRSRGSRLSSADKDFHLDSCTSTDIESLPRLLLELKLELGYTV